jgi:phage baseplate assembly protein gpV/phage protein D
MTVLAPPKLLVTLEGLPLADEETRALGEVRVQQRLSLPTLCELTFFDPGAAFARRAPALPGVLLRVGVDGQAQTLFDGQVTAAEFQYGPAGGVLVRLRGYDRLHQLRKRQPVRRHTGVGLIDLATELTADLGLRVEATETGPRWDTLVQFWQSDLELLAELAERSGLYFTLRDEVLHLLTLQGIGSPVPLTLGQSLLEARIDVNGEPACRSVETLAWDPWHAEPHRGLALDAEVGRRIGAEAAPARFGAKGERTLADATAQSDSQALALAQAELDRRVAREVTLWGVAAGDPALRPGTPIEVKGLAPPLEGRYSLTSVNHTLDRQRGFLSEIDTAPPQPRGRSRGSVATVGTVTHVDDPEHLGRVRASLIGYQDIESDWLAVLIPGAGAGKGLICLPDIGDRVLILAAADDPSQAVVLGGLYGTQSPPDAGVDGGAVKRYTFVTPGGQQIQMDDDKKSLRIENHAGCVMELAPGRARIRDSAGSFVELAGKAVRIHAETDLEIEAPGKAITIRGNSIDFRKG